MEFLYDWRNFRRVMLPPPAAGGKKPAYVIVDRDRVVQAYADGEDMNTWLGSTPLEMTQQMPDREFIVLTREQVEGSWGEAISLSQWQEQAELHRSKLNSLGVKIGKYPQNFLIETLTGRWSKAFPSRYGIFLRLEGPGGRDFFVQVGQKGKLEAFHEPDLMSLRPDRSKSPADIIKYLSERYHVPVQGIFLPISEWKVWCQSAKPWREIFSSVRGRRAKLIPYRPALLGYLTLRAVRGR